MTRADSNWDDYETEYKFSISRARAVDFIGRTTRWLTPDIYDPARPVAYARTTYFDTDARDYFHSSQSAVRRRLRMREYASAATLGSRARLTGVRYLELKQSAGGKRVKLRALAVARAGGRIAGRWELAASADPEAARRLERELSAPTLQPRLEVWYRRQSFASPPHVRAHVRVTVDTDIAFGVPSATHVRVGGGPPCIVEVKFVRRPWWIDYAMRGLGDPLRLSKFELGNYALAVEDTLTDRVTA